ncbi:transposase-like protein [Beauveria bassiana ARSEF 2860]|uniref:Transposase-like protein n=1 Tax=Beauveria bassiana (strain ARSEF 2860) TaxID=655819 RepID=J4UFQ4_BEAB2|nr:transposase-like protein [Beauveria bassiana ARSEF 2860]EJP61432.1 transposase-like protein [Beauveria bassiana ARSEF 2860]
MRTAHGITIEEEERPAKKALQQSLEVAFMHAEQKSREIATRSEESILRNTIQLDAFYEAQIQLITRRRLPLNCVSGPEYQALLCAVNPKAEEVLVQSGTTVFAHIERSYLLHREAIKSQLQAAKSKIHFSIDLWSSPHRKAFLGICGQWVDEHYNLREALLGLPNVRHSHSGETMSGHLLDTIRYFGIADNVGYFTISIFSIPAMSAEAERVFSGARRTVS